MIRFPKHHIAASVVNRLMNVADELEADAILTGTLPRTSAPAIPTNPAQQSAEIDLALQQPTPATPALEDAPDPGGTAAGKPLLATMLEQQ